MNFHCAFSLNWLNRILVYILDPLLNIAGEKKTQQNQTNHTRKPQNLINSQSGQKVMKKTDTFIHIRGQNYAKTFTLENQVNDFMKWGYSVSNIWVLKSDGKEWR